MKRKFFHNFILVFSSNGVGLLLSIVMNIVLPIVFRDSIAEYGYVQLYLLCVGYYYIFDMGLCNGIYLREGGSEYTSLNKSVYSSQLRLLAAEHVLIGIIITILTSLLVHDAQKSFAFFMVAFNIVIMQTKTFFSVILQATNRIREYSYSIIICKFLNVVAIVLSLAIKSINSRTVITLLTLGEISSLFYLIFQCRDIAFHECEKFDLVKGEIKENIRSGIALLISGVSAMLMLGFSRLSIENQWGIEIFAKISFTLSFTNLFMLFINAVSVVLYPQMKRMPEGKYVDLYMMMRDLLMPILFIALTLYYPLRTVLESVLPQYRDGLVYMSILLPICIYTSKMNLLIQTYLKALRNEKKLMIVNVVSFVFSASVTIVTVYLIKNLIATAFGIVISQAFRAVLAEAVLSRHIEISIGRDIVYELILSAVFIVSNWSIRGWVGVIVYIIAVCLYLAIKAKSIRQGLAFVFKSKTTTA